MSVIRKKQEEKNLKILRELLTFEGNRYCFDCNQRGPTYVNITIGSFVCTNCGGALRKYSHRLKSISMTNFNQTEMDFIKKRGNNICKKIYYGLCENNIPPEMDIKNGMLDSHLRAKYELKKWYLEPSADLEEETVAQNQMIFDRVERGVPKPTKSYSVNSSSNIIIDPPKSTANKLGATKGSRVSIDLVENTSPFDTPSQPKSSNTVTNSIDPSKLAGGSAVKLPIMSTDNKTPNWLSNNEDKINQNSQSPFGDDFLFSTVKEKAPIAKSQTMNFSMPPLIPMSQGPASDTAHHGSVHYGESKSADKYAALAELDDLFSSTSVSKMPPAWDAGANSNYAWYGGTAVALAPVPPIAPIQNPFSTNHHYSGAPVFNPFAGEAGPSQGQWPAAQAPAANPFMMSAPGTAVNSKNPFL